MSMFARVILLVLIIAMQPGGAPEPLHFLRAIELPRVEGRIDHLTLDSTGQFLFVAALGNNTVEVIDVKNGVHVRSLPGFREPQGLAAVPDAKAIAVASGQGEGVQTIDENGFTTLKTISLGDDADNVRYDAAAKKLYVGYGGGGPAPVGPGGGESLPRGKLAGHPPTLSLQRPGPPSFV